MRKMNGIKLFIGTCILLFVSQVAAKTMSLFWILFTILILFLIVGLLQICRKRENMWLFILTVVGSIPINLTIVKSGSILAIFDSGIPVVGTLIAAVEVYLLLLALEEILVGIMGRFIWRRQYKIIVEK